LRRYDGLALIVTIFFFSLQIYCDFSGYSSIAIGTAKLMGVDLMTNFSAPYFSSSIREFWKRWHISLSTWFRDYVYIPLGGNRCSDLKQNRNLLITFLVSGMWHGADLTFLIWGGLHGCAQIIENIFYKSIKKIKQWRIGRYLSWLVVFGFCNVTWVFFRAANLDDAVYVLTNILNGITMPAAYIQKGYMALDINCFMLFYLGMLILILAAIDFVTYKKGTLKLACMKNKGIEWGIYIILGVFILFVFTLLPPIITQTGPVLENIIYFIKEISFKYNFDFHYIFSLVNNIYDFFLKNAGNYLEDIVPSFIGASINLITLIFIIITSFIYFTYDMDKIRNKIKEILKNKNKIYNYLSGLDKEMNNYLSGFWIIIIITFFEYLIAYFIIGHPNYLVLAFLAAISNLIPYFGGILVNLVAFITSITVSPTLLLKTCILWVICMIVDGYIIGPLFYGKKSNLHPLVVIIALFAGGLLGGFWGIILSIPGAIMVIYTLRFLKQNYNIFK